MLQRLILLAALMLGGYAFGQSPVQLSPLFSDGVVLQRQSDVPIFGTADPASRVEVTASWNPKHPVVTCADSTGRFVARIRTPRAGGPYRLTVNDRVVEQVMIGEVWLCSGQSNMQFDLGSSDLSQVRGEENPLIRIFTVPIESAETPRSMLPGGRWHYGPVDSIKSRVSAVAYYFARRLQRELDIPIGILSSSRGATAAEEWMDPQLFMGMDSSVRERFLPPAGRHAGCWYNAMIAPLIPYRIAGFVWYQGENNSSRPETYFQLMSALIAGWRADFGDASLPFYLVELAPFSQDWSSFRLVQHSIADRVAHCGFVSILDAGDVGNIHPVNKFPVGERLAQLALSNVYGRGSRSEGPRFRNARPEDGRLRLHFDNLAGVLVVRSSDSVSLVEVAGADGIFSPARVKADGRTLLAWSEEVPRPLYARYFHGRYASPTLFAADGWPVAPFCMETPCAAVCDSSRYVCSQARYNGQTMPCLSDPAWIPFGVDAAGARLALEDGSLRLAMNSGVYGYRLPVLPRKEPLRSLCFSAAVEKGALDVVAADGCANWISLKVTPDAVVDGISGDTLASGLDNGAMADFRAEVLDDHRVRVCRNGVAIGTYEGRGDSSFADGFEEGRVNRRVYAFSPWSKWRIAERQPLSGTRSLVWQNGTTGLMSAEWRVKPCCSYRLSFKAAIPAGGAHPAKLKGTIKCGDRAVEPVVISGDAAEYVFTIRTRPEDRTLKLVLHNGYDATQALELWLDDLRLDECEMTPTVAFGNLDGGAAACRIGNLKAE